MSVTPQNILDSAIEMQDDASEMATRNTISRAYYAAYHLAIDVFPVDKKAAQNSQTGVHDTYITQLQKSNPDSVERFTGVKLNTLKGKRRKADYFLNDDIRPFEAAMQIKTAEELFSTLEEYRSTSTTSAHQTSNSISPENTGATNNPASPQRPKLQRMK